MTRRYRQKVVSGTHHDAQRLKKKRFRSKLPKGLHLGNIKGTFRREEIYDFI